MVGCGEPGGLEHRRRDVDHVAELRADLALALDALGPVHDRAVAGAAEVRRHLLGPLIGRVHRVRPAHGVVVVGVRPAEVVDLAHEEFGRLERAHAVEHRHLVEAAVRRAFGGGAVVAEDVVDQRVVEDLQVLQRVEQAADVVVGVLEERGIDLHLAGENRLERRGHVVVGGDLVGPLGQDGIRRESRPAPSGGRRSLRAPCPSRRRTCPCTCRSTPSARDAGRGWRRARSR